MPRSAPRFELEPADECAHENTGERIGEGMPDWSCQGRTRYGLSEYLDQLD